MNDDRDDLLDIPRVTDEERDEALNVLYSWTEACPLCGEVHPT